MTNITSTSLKETLKAEIESYDQVEPAVPVLIDESGAFFWVTKEGKYVWLSEGKGMEDYIDEDHQPVSENRSEGVCNNGVIWLNTDFNSPFHISDFLKTIETITI